MDAELRRRKCMQWMVCFAAWWTEFITMGLFFSYGTIFVALVTEYKTSETLAAWIGSLSYCVFHISSTIVQTLNNYLGYRDIGFCGGLLFGLGLISSSFVKQSSWLLLSYGLLVGLGCGLSRFSAIFALPRYFPNRTSVALGVSLSGYGFGAIGVGYITEAAYSRLGLHNTFRVLAGFALVLMLGSLAFRPLPSRAKKTEKESRLRYQNPLKLLNNKLMLAHCIAFWLYCVGLYIPNVHLVYMAENAKIPSLLATLLPSSMAVAQSFGRVIFGHLASSNRISISPVASCQVTMLLCSLATTLCPLARTFPAFMAYAVSLGFLDSCSTIMALEIIQRILGRDGLNDGYALQMTGTGIPGAIGPAMAGASLGRRYGDLGVPSPQDPPLGVAGRVRRKGRADIQSVSAQLQKLPEGFTVFHQPPTGLLSGFYVWVDSLSLFLKIFRVIIGLQQGTGFLYEVSGSYFVPFAVAGAFQTSCVCILFLVSLKGRNRDIFTLEDTRELIENSFSSQSCEASEIEKSRRPMDNKDCLSTEVEGALSTMDPKLPPYHLEVYNDKDTERVLSDISVRKLLSKRIRRDSIVFTERETVL